MKLSSLIARTVAAGAVVGLALVGPAVAAGAASLPVSLPVPLPVGIGQVGSSPVVEVGPSASSPAGSGSDVFVPAHGDGTASVPTASSGGGQAATAHGSADACIAAALLSGHDAKRCGDGAGTAGGKPSLAGSLTRIGSCAGLALERGQSTDSCVDFGSNSKATPLDDDAAGKVLAENGLCDVAAQLGLSGIDACNLTGAAVPSARPGLRARSGADAGTGADASAGADAGTHAGARAGSATPADAQAGFGARAAAEGGSGTPAGADTFLDLCRGLAVVGGVDPALCLVGSAVSSAAPQSSFGVRKAASAPAQLSADCGSGAAGVDAPASPFGDPVSAGLGALGAVAGLGMGLRRRRLPHLG